MAAGSISLDEFNVAITTFIEHSNTIGDTWRLETVATNGHGRYLCKKVSMTVKICPREDETMKDIKLVQEEEEYLDKATLEEPSLEEECIEKTQGATTWEYHVVYSPSYSVPVLYFNAYKKDGRLLSLESVWSSVPSHFQHRLREERWSFITQQEHPLLRRPFFQLHPCHTALLMGQVYADKKHSSNYIVSWLSTVGPVVHLPLPLSYATMSDAPPSEEHP